MHHVNGVLIIGCEEPRFPALHFQVNPHLLFEIAVELPPSKQEQQPAPHFSQAFHMNFRPVG